MTLKCVRCGMDFPADSAKCKNCKSPMTCMEDMCKCQTCDHQQEMDNMWCPECLEAETVK